jgi:type IV secretory pathway TraG/TraD family ATPase VirD4
MKSSTPYRVVFGITSAYAAVFILTFLLAPVLGVPVPANIRGVVGHIFLPLLALNNVILFSILLHQARNIPFSSDTVKYTILAPLAFGVLVAIALDLFVSNEFIVYGILTVFVTISTWFSVPNGTRNVTGEIHFRGSKVVHSSDLKSTLKGSVSDFSLTIGGVPLEWKYENYHTLIIGAPGSGKSQAMNEEMRTVRRRGDPAVIVDPAGGFFGRYSSEENIKKGYDILLNPMDEKTVPWSPLAEIEGLADFSRIAAAMIPDANSSDDNFFTPKAQGQVADVMRVMHSRGESSPKILWKWLNADPETLGEFLEGTSSAHDCKPQNAKMFGSIRATVTKSLSWLEHLQESETYFSVRQWVRKEANQVVQNEKGQWVKSGEGNKGWLFITYRDDQMKLLSGFVSMVADLALLESLSLPENDQRRIFFLLDEVDALGKIGELINALARVRKFGGALIIGVQTIAQLRSVYGRDGATTILGTCSTKLIMRPADHETAKEAEAMLGEQIVIRPVVSTATGTGSNFSGMLSSGSHKSTTSTTSDQYVKQSAIMASQLLSIPTFEDCFRGVLIRPGQPHTIVDVPLVKMPFLIQPFTPRKADQLTVKVQADAS